MSGEQQDKQRAIEAAKQAGLRNDGTDDTWGGNSTAFKGRGIYVEAHIGDQLTSLRAAVPNDTLQAILHPITKEQIAKAVHDGAEAEYYTDDEEFNIPRLVERVKAILFPEEAPTGANPAGGAHA